MASRFGTVRLALRGSPTPNVPSIQTTFQRLLSNSAVVSRRSVVGSQRSVVGSQRSVVGSQRSVVGSLRVAGSRNVLSTRSFSSRSFSSESAGSADAIERDQMEYDLLIVGAGPAGLGAAIRAKQIAMEQDKELNVCVIDKGSEVGSHILSGNIFEPRALNELIGDWKEKGAPLDTPVTNEEIMYFPNGNRSFNIPSIFFAKEQHNNGNYVISLGMLCRWLGEQAEELGVDVFPGFAADQFVYTEDGSQVTGVQLKDVGIAKDGSVKDTFEPGMQLLAKQTILAEGCRGSLSLAAQSKFNLTKDSCPQHYGFGLKEVWEVENADPGYVAHSVGWPLDNWTYGGSFIYHMNPNLIHIGMVIGLDYKNPHLNPYMEFQRFKHHPKVAKMLEGGTCVQYGARCINEGGLQAVPKLTFPGGMMAGCSAGFLNVMKIKGSHTAMKTGMLAGEEVAKALLAAPEGDDPMVEITAYETAYKNSWVYDELKIVRNCQPSFKYGLFGGLASAGFHLHITRGREPWTLKWTKRDCDYTEPAAKHKKIEYPKPDGKLSFDILDNLIRSGVNHEHDQPAHLKVKDELKDTPLDISLAKFDGPEQRFCPAKVYEYVDDGEGGKKLQINAQNCVHCKCCSIKTPNQFINWTVPEGAGGPQYQSM